MRYLQFNLIPLASNPSTLDIIISSKDPFKIIQHFIKFAIMDKRFLIDTEIINSARKSFRAVVQKDQNNILKLLESKGPLRVTEIYKKLNIEQSRASASLAILRKYGIVKYESVSTRKYYSLDYNQLEKMNTAAKKLLKMEER